MAGPAGAWRRLDGLQGRINRWRRARHATTDVIASLAFFLLPQRGGQKRECPLQMDGVIFNARREDWVAVEETVLQGEYDFVRALIAGDQPVVVDLGANIGLFSLLLYSWARSARFYLAEPSQRTADLLRRNLALNPAMRCTVMEAAIWTGDGSIEFHEDPAASTAGAIRRRESTTASSRVACLSLASFLRQCALSSVDILKMDIEGVEQAVLSHDRDLLRCIEALIVEVHPPESSIDQVAALLTEEFEFLYAIGGRTSSKPLLLATRRPQTDLVPYAV